MTGRNFALVLNNWSLKPNRKIIQIKVINFNAMKILKMKMHPVRLYFSEKNFLVTRNHVATHFMINICVIWPYIALK